MSADHEADIEIPNIQMTKADDSMLSNSSEQFFDFEKFNSHEHQPFGESMAILYNFLFQENITSAKLILLICM